MRRTWPNGGGGGGCCTKNKQKIRNTLTDTHKRSPSQQQTTERNSESQYQRQICQYSGFPHGVEVRSGTEKWESS